MFAYIWISSINWLQMKSQTIVYLPCMYVHTLFYTSELYCEAIFINNWSATSPGLNASLAFKILTQMRKIILNYSKMETICDTYIVYVIFFYSQFFFYLHTDDVKILSSFFYHQIFFSAFSLMKSWLTRMNSLQSFLCIVTLQWNLYRKNWNVSVVTWYILRTINALMLLTDLTKMIYDTLILLR